MRLLSFFLRTIATGLFAILPIFLTVVIIGWVGSWVTAYLGPQSWFGQNVALLGAFVVNDNLAYLLGAAIVLAGLYVIGLLIQTRLRILWTTFFDETLGRLPLIGTIYKTITRFVQLLERRDDVDVQSMSPVWCFFSEERKVSVLGLMPTNQPLTIEGETYHVVMIPTAPVPFGGGLFFLPADWVRPASFGVEGLTNIYVSMGVTAPDYMSAIRDAKKKVPRVVHRDGAEAAVSPPPPAEPGAPA
jgi:uncharacterized membrane protein